MTQVDLIIRNGRIIDPKNGINTINDIAVRDSKIYAIGSNLQLSAIETYDAAAEIVCPGLVDLHIHGYEFATELGINPDKCCLSRGVTTVVDAGSAGRYNIGQVVDYKYTQVKIPSTRPYMNIAELLLLQNIIKIEEIWI